MSAYDAFRDLPLKIESHELVRNELPVSSGFTRVTTEIVLRGGGKEGRGEDVSYDEIDHEVLSHDAELDLSFEGTFDEFSRHLETLPLWVAPPVREASLHYRTWGFESAALDLALRQNDLDFATALGREPQPVRFIVSLRLGEPPSIAPIEKWLAVVPGLEFKLDAENSWPRELFEQIAAVAKVDQVDLKGHYEGTVVDNPPTPELYSNAIECFPDAWIEDPAFTDETRPLLTADGVLERLTWDAPMESLDDLKALEFPPRGMNIKPSRFGSVKELLAVIEHCLEHDIEMYSGGQFELSVGRGQLHAVAAVFYPDSPNDASPVAFHSSEPTADAPSSPLPVPPVDQRRGFRYPA